MNVFFSQYCYKTLNRVAFKKQLVLLLLTNSLTPVSLRKKNTVYIA